MRARWLPLVLAGAYACQDVTTSSPPARSAALRAATAGASEAPPGSVTPASPTPAPGASSAPATAPPLAGDALSAGDPTTELIRASNHLALALWRHAPAGNLALSPVSVASSLAIAWGGAKGQTAAQLQRVLSLDGAPDALLSRWGMLTRAVQDPARAPLLRIASRLYGERSLSIDTIYFTLVRKAFDVWIEPVDFAGDLELARGKIDAWVAEQTDRTIGAMLPPGAVTAETRLAVIHASYFVARWARAFDPAQTRPRDFFPGGKARHRVATMQQTGTFPYARAEGAALVELPCQGGTAAVYLMLPDQRDGLASVEDRLDLTLRSLQRALAPRRVQVALPRFAIDPAAPHELSAPLRELGVQDAFDPGKADFSNLASPTAPGQRAFLSTVLHEAIVQVDERGAAPNAASPGGPPPRAAETTPVEFTADHPFLFVVVDRTTGLILFLGRVVDPTG